jgi:YegS/Rv2252/BmrU family lipid kinase
VKKKIRFIINPKSGVHQKLEIPDLINRLVDREKYDYEIFFTEGPHHGTSLSKETADKNYFAAVSVGGDGSANEVAKGVSGSKTSLGIIPCGSGNGMARHLKIPMKIEKAFQVINTGSIEKIDTVRANEEFCISTIGVGFDAHIAHLFANSSKRGYLTYAKLVLAEFHKYKPATYELTVDGKTISKECFLLAFANSSQYGNDAVIAPFADIRDGIVDISMMRKFPLLAAPFLVYRLMHNSIHKSKFFSMVKGKNIVLKNNQELKGHIDGEPVLFNSDIHIKIIPESLNVILP